MDPPPRPRSSLPSDVSPLCLCTLLQYAPQARAWVGESALTGGGGHDNVTNAFFSTLWFADWLGFNARRNVSVVMRETLIGGYYGLVDSTTFAVAPDAYMMALFSQLMGPAVHAAAVEVRGSALQQSMLRAYAHQARGGGGGTVLLLINLGSRTTFSVKPPTVAGVGGSTVASGTTRAEDHLTAADGRPGSKQMKLNSVLLQLDANGTAIPAFAPLATHPNADEPILVGPASVVFVVLATSPVTA